MELTERTAIVTGGTSGIGIAIVDALAGQGCHVAFSGRDPERVSHTIEKLKSQNVDALGASCDVRDTVATHAFVSTVRARYGPVDILVNNAGLGHIAELHKLTDAQIEETLDVNVTGVFRMTRAVLDEMLERQTGHVVNIASLAGKNGFARGTAYSASKHAVLGFSRSLMLEVRNLGVRVSAICPGSVDTPFFDSSGMTLEHPERVLRARDVAEAVVWALTRPEHALVSELDVRPASP